jgi:hypothetical protein
MRFMEDVLIGLSLHPISKGLCGEPFSGILVEDTHISSAGLYIQTGREHYSYRPFRVIRIVFLEG